MAIQKAVPGANVAVLGASPKEERYSNKAVKMLKQHGFRAIPVHPAEHLVDGDPSLKDLSHISDKIDTLTVYVGPNISSGELDRILQLKPRRVIFNPGAENEDLAAKLEEAGIEVVKACTLVLLQTGQF